MTFIVAILSVVLIAYLLIPMVKQSTDTQVSSYEFTKSTNYSVAGTITLPNVPLDNSTLRIEHSNASASLSTGRNYTLLSTDTGQVSLTNTNVGTYTAYYSYYNCDLLIQAELLGVAATVHKPVDPLALVALVRDLASHPAPDSGVESPAPEADKL